MRRRDETGGKGTEEMDEWKERGTGKEMEEGRKMRHKGVLQGRKKR